MKSPALTTMGAGTPDSGEGEDVSLNDFMAHVAGNHGYSFSSSLDVKRKFWAQDGESFANLTRRIAGELGADFEIVGNKVFMMPSGQLPNGMQTINVEATWGVNLISWRIKPYAGRAQWQGSQQRFFDIWNGLWKKTKSALGGDTPFGGAMATGMLPFAAPNSQAGQQWNDGQNNIAQKGRGTGWAIINGEPTAQARGSLVISGARPGVDGRYRIKEAEHNYSRGGGYTTRCDLEHPELQAQDYKDQSTYEKIGAAELEKQLQENPVFWWTEAAPPPIIPGINDNIVPPDDL
jgi:hypothetical protein